MAGQTNSEGGEIDRPVLRVIARGHCVCLVFVPAGQARLDEIEVLRGIAAGRRVGRVEGRVVEGDRVKTGVVERLQGRRKAREARSTRTGDRCGTVGHGLAGLMGDRVRRRFRRYAVGPY